MYLGRSIAASLSKRMGLPSLPGRLPGPVSSPVSAMAGSFNVRPCAAQKLLCGTQQQRLPTSGLSGRREQFAGGPFQTSVAEDPSVYGRQNEQRQSRRGDESTDNDGRQGFL